MSRAGRRPRFGRYVAPEPAPPALLDDVVAEGLLIAASAARLAVTNKAVVRLLRDREDADIGWYRDELRQQLLALAVEKGHDVERARDDLARARRQPSSRLWIVDTDRVELARLERRHAMLLGLVDTLHRHAADEAYLVPLAQSVRRGVLDELESAVRLRALPADTAPPLEGDARAGALRDLRDELQGLSGTS